MTNPANIKAFFCDLDDTLLRDDLSIDAYDAKMMRKLQEKGVSVILTSGRRCFDCQEKFDRMGLKNENSYIVGCGGGEVVKAGTLENVRKVSLDEESIRKTVEYCRANNYCLQVYIEENQLVSTVYNEFHEYHLHILNMKDKRFTFDEVLEFSLKEHPLKLLVLDNPELLRTKIVPELRALLPSSTRVVISKPSFSEIFPVEVSKESAVCWVCANVLHCTMTEAASCGDCDVDVEMLRGTGLSFAPANSNANAKAAAKHVLPWTNEERAVGRMIREYFFPGDKEEEGEKEGELLQVGGKR